MVTCNQRKEEDKVILKGGNTMLLGNNYVIDSSKLQETIMYDIKMMQKMIGHLGGL